MAKKTPNQEKANKQLKRIRNAIRRLEKKGYRLDKEQIPTIPKRITQSFLKKLESITPSFLRKNATAISEKTGKVISGEEKFKEDKQIAAEKATQTRKRKSQPDFNTQRSAQDEIERQRAEQFSLGNMILDKIEGMIKGFPRAGSFLLNKLVSDEIAKYGTEKTLAGLAGAPERALELADIIYYGSDEYSPALVHSAILEFIEILRSGEVPSEADAREYGEMLDNIGYDDEMY